MRPADGRHSSVARRRVLVTGDTLASPRLPLDGQFATSSVLGDSRAHRSIRLTGDWTQVRSWMDAADMAAWCWTLLARCEPSTAYNVGSEESVEIGDAAARVAALAATRVPVVRGREPQSGAAPGRYVPSTQRAGDAFGLDTWIGFGDALRRTWDWLCAGS